MFGNKKKILVYVLISLLVSITYIGQASAADYENYFGIEMTNAEYNTLLNLGFTEDEIYYMNEETYLENKDADATLVTKNEKYYKTVYTDLNGNPYSVEVDQDEYNNQPTLNARNIVTTEYKQMITTISQNGSKFRYKVSLAWKNMPSTKDYDIIGIGFADDVKIDSSLYFSYHWCKSSGDCYTESYFRNRKSTSTGGAVMYQLPSNPVALSSTLYYDVSKDTTDTITYLKMCGDYAHAQSEINVSYASDYYISIGGIGLSGNLISYYDTIPCAISTWSGSW